MLFCLASISSGDWGAKQNVLFSRVISASCYNAVSNQTDSSPLIVASGKRISKRRHIEHRWIAISRDLKRFLNYGDSVWISGTKIYDGYWVVQDLMNKRFSNKIDFLVDRSSYISSWDSLTIYK